MKKQAIFIPFLLLTIQSSKMLADSRFDQAKKEVNAFLANADPMSEDYTSPEAGLASNKHYLQNPS